MRRAIDPPKRKNLPVRMTDTMHEELANRAASDGRSMSSYVLRLIEADLKAARKAVKR